jgi:hypothetical protein
VDPGHLFYTLGQLPSLLTLNLDRNKLKRIHSEYLPNNAENYNDN